MVQYQS